MAGSRFPTDQPTTVAYQTQWDRASNQGPSRFFRGRDRPAPNSVPGDFALGIGVFDFHNTRIPRDPRDPRVPGFWSPAVTCQTYLRKGTRVWVDVDKVLRTPYRVLKFNCLFYLGLIEQSLGLQGSPHVFRLPGDWTCQRMGGLSTAVG